MDVGRVTTMHLAAITIPENCQQASREREVLFEGKRSVHQPWKTTEEEPREAEGECNGALRHRKIFGRYSRYHHPTTRSLLMPSDSLCSHQARALWWLGVSPTPHKRSQNFGKLSRDDGTIAIPGIYDNVRLLPEEERRALRELPFDHAAFRKHAGCSRCGFNATGRLHPHEMIWHRPQVSMNAIQSSSKHKWRTSLWILPGPRSVSV